eukprot:TRINITY_DN3015_c0_g1_i1.p3 TRINITY_DN3015_c0_g1~~TRINITY_DN3015_c0_g1_i1.p3  ORF type:complete len:143 (-),score=2.20 TRINITY_DN3015_c0_g1_i1:249-677(-)
MEEHFLSFSAKLIKNIIFRGQDFVSLCLLKKEKKNKKSTTQGGPCQFEFYRFRNNFFQDSVKQFYSIINFTNKNGKLSYFAFEYSQMQVINSNHTSKRAGMGVQNFNNNHFMQYVSLQYLSQHVFSYKNQMFIIVVIVYGYI